MKCTTTITLLVCLTSSGVGGIIYSKSRTEILRLQFDRRVRDVGVVTLEKAVRLAVEIKPVMVVVPALDEADFVVGRRIFGHRASENLFRLSGVYTFGWLISLLLGKKIPDFQVGSALLKWATPAKSIFGKTNITPVN